MKIVLTGGPCAGKTTLTHILGRVFAAQSVVVPETATVLFSGGFPRWQEEESADATQRAIYHVQCELEEAYRAHYPGMSLIMDRGTIDGAAYWSSGAENYFEGVGTTLNKEFARYDHVLYLESADEQAYLKNKCKNPNRTESWERAKFLDKVTRDIWSRHPSFYIISNNHSFDVKILKTLSLMGDLLNKKSQAG